MAKQPGDETEQLELTLIAEAKRALSCEPEPVKVVGFLDAATLATRREATQRVRSSGIFAIPRDSTRNKR
jgi:hypothetical protein